MEQKSADAVSVLVMNPQNGEIMAMVNVPEFDLNDPFTLNTSVDTTGMTEEQKQDLLNQMWRNRCINDTYEPGSTFKIITAASGLEEGVVHLDDQFSCPRAFQNVHGIAPSLVKKGGVPLKSYPPISFKITIKGAAEMNYREKGSFLR